MDKTVELINSASTFVTMKNSKLNENKIINFDIPFSVVDLIDINLHKIYLTKRLFEDNVLYDFTDKIMQLDNLLDCKIRIWCSHFDSDSYIFLCYICNYLRNKNCDLYVVFSDDYNKDYCTPAILSENELKEANNFEHKLNKEDIKKLSDEWCYIYDNDCDIRIMRNKKVQLVSDDYFDEIILNTLKLLGSVKLSKLVAKLLSNYDHLIYIIYVYLVDRLIKLGKIKIVKENKERDFENIIECN